MWQGLDPATDTGPVTVWIQVCFLICMCWSVCTWGSCHQTVMGVFHCSCCHHSGRNIHVHSSQTTTGRSAAWAGPQGSLTLYGFYKMKKVVFSRAASRFNNKLPSLKSHPAICLVINEYRRSDPIALSSHSSRSVYSIFWLVHFLFYFFPKELARTSCIH